MTLSFQVPQKAILTSDQLAAFQESPTHTAIVDFVEGLNDAVIGAKLSDAGPDTPAITALLAVLDRVEEVANATPPVPNAASRFGNPAFRTFYDHIAEITPELHDGLPRLPSEAVPELSAYFAESWGNRARIDYGSGMELNFLCWLLCLERLGVTAPAERRALVLRVFWRYIGVMRTLQASYWLEPAGSHGVWGLDDYHFLPFVFGAAQLRGHKYLRPRAIHDADVVDECAREYMYFACIRFINSIKSASLRWHSPMLDDISAVKTWEKVNTGMLKMYRAEVLGKLPVAQHFLFGSLLPFTGPAAPPGPDGEDKDGAHAGHAHGAGAGWGDCCGIPVPSAFAAARALEAPGLRLAGPAVRPVPFD